MSFSYDVKHEIYDKIEKSIHCQIAEIAAIMAFCGQVEEDALVVTSENELVIHAFESLIANVYSVSDKDYVIVGSVKKSGGIQYILLNKEVQNILLMSIKWKNGDEKVIERKFVDHIIIQKECCKKAFIRGAFLAAGSISDPNKFYHFEIVCESINDAEEMKNLLLTFNLDAKTIARKKNFITYIKEGNYIMDALNIIGAFVAQMNMCNIMILKGISNDVNRKVNCETANINKTVEAAVRQIEDIEYINDTVGLSYLKDSLYEVAMVRLENPDMNLKDIGELLSPPVGKSGVNHRLRKISEIAEELRKNN